MLGTRGTLHLGDFGHIQRRLLGLNRFRALAQDNGIDPERFINSLGGDRSLSVALISRFCTGFRPSHAAQLKSHLWSPFSPNPSNPLPGSFRSMSITVWRRPAFSGQKNASNSLMTKSFAWLPSEITTKTWSTPFPKSSATNETIATQCAPEGRFPSSISTTPNQTSFFTSEG